MSGKSEVIAEWPSDTAPGRDDVRRALDAVLASEMFRGSAKLGAFLRFVVETTLRGEQDRIKGYTIGVEALGREESFDPQIDPIVRVEATRLRRTLDRYYAGPGADDDIIFELTRGSYVPNIRVRRPDGIATGHAAAEPEGPTPKSRHLGIALAALAAVLIVAAGALILTRYPERSGRTVAASDVEANQTFSGPLQAGNGMPTLAIPRISILGMPPQPGALRPQLNFANVFTEKLRTAMARFDTLNVAGDPTEEPGGPGPALSAKPEASADYHLLGSGEIQEDGSANVRFRLLDAAAGNVVWSRTFGPFALTTDYGPTEDLIVYQLSTTLAPPYGVIRALERVRQLAGGARDPRYRCILEASESFRTFDPAQHARARACLETLTARDPGYAMGFAYLAAVYTREYQYQFGDPTDPQLLDRALRAGRQGVELSPESARAYQMLFTVLFARRDTAAAFAAGDKALALNPNDMTILSDYGGRLVLAGEIDRGMETLKRAADDGVVRASWYHFYLFLGSYLRNDKENAAHHANQIAIDARPLGLLARALVAAANGNREGARDAYGQLAAASPGWHARPKEELARLFPSSTVVDRIMHDLVAAGVVPAD